MYKLHNSIFVICVILGFWDFMYFYIFIYIHVYVQVSPCRGVVVSYWVRSSIKIEAGDSTRKTMRKRISPYLSAAPNPWCANQLNKANKYINSLKEFCDPQRQTDNEQRIICKWSLENIRWKADYEKQVGKPIKKIIILESRRNRSRSAYSKYSKIEIENSNIHKQ